MKGEIPVFKRCCLCLPLRHGLLVWGYFKMTADAILITLMMYSIMQQVLRMNSVHNTVDDYLGRIYEDMIGPVIALAVFIVDFMATIIFIVGGHKKNLKLIRPFYFISVVMWIFTLLLNVTTVVLTIQNLTLHVMDFWERTMLIFSFYFVVLVLQSYFLILLRSEIIKLRNNGEFKFVNNAAEAECTMTIEEAIEVEETERV